jgi:heat shock protein HslJ
MSAIQRCIVLSLLPVLLMACARRPAAENTAVTDTVRPDASVSAPELINTYWKLTSLADTPVTATDNKSEPHMVLNPDPKQVDGSGGCNRFFGSYQTSGNALSFAGIGSTRMACPSGMDTEGAFLSALGRAATWRVSGLQLELSDSTGAVLARFEARATK